MLNPSLSVRDSEQTLIFNVHEWVEFYPQYSNQPQREGIYWVLCFGPMIICLFIYFCQAY